MCNQPVEFLDEDVELANLPVEYTKICHRIRFGFLSIDIYSKPVAFEYRKFAFAR